MATYKKIYWDSDQKPRIGIRANAHVHLLVGYNQASLADFRKMADELRQTFPEADDSTICGGKVFKSHTVDGHTIVTWQGSVVSKDYPGWTQRLLSDLELFLVITNPPKQGDPLFASGFLFYIFSKQFRTL